MSRHMALLPGFLLVLAAPALSQSKDASPPVNNWAAWAAYPEGAWVTRQIDRRGQSKDSYTQTLTKKTADLITVKEEMEKKDDPNAAAQPPLILPVPGFENGEWHYARTEKPAPCPTCGSAHKASLVTPQKAEKIKIGTKDILCLVIDVVPFDCKGEKDGTSRWWISKDVPGGLVKRETVAADRPGKVVELVIDFDKKKKPDAGGK